MKRHSLRLRILFGLAGIAIIVVSGIFFSQSMIADLEREIQRRIIFDMEMLRETNDMLLISEEMQRLALQAASELDEDMLLNAAKVSNRFFERSEKLRDLVGTQGVHFVSPPVVGKIDALESDYRALITLALPILAAQIENQTPNRKAFAEIRAAGEIFKRNIELFHRDITYHINNETAEISNSIDKSMRVSFVVIAFIIAMLIFAIIFIDRKLVIPMRDVAAFLSRTGVDPVHASERLAHIHNNEIGKISLQINSLLDQLHKTAVSRDYVDGIVGSIRGALFVLTPDFVIRDVNSAACHLLNANQSELRGKRIFDFAASRDFGPTLDGLLGDIKIDHAESNLRATSGAVVPVLLSGSVVRSDNGKPRDIILIAADITSLKETERELSQKTIELERSNSDLQQFAYVASHDLQEPLRMISSYLQLLERRFADKLDQDGRDFIAFAVDGAKRMRGLILDLLAFSRVKTKAAPLVRTDMAEIVDVALKNLQSAIEESKAIVEVNPMPYVAGDATQLISLIQNLISNAIKYRNPERQLEIVLSAEQEASGWRFSIKDNGIGIDPAYFERIFIIFQRLHTRDEYEGSGIGLAICKKIVERHGGDIWLESTPNQGTTFYFTVFNEESAEILSPGQ